jgi:hypothetical protein
MHDAVHCVERDSIRSARAIEKHFIENLATEHAHVMAGLILAAEH